MTLIERLRELGFNGNEIGHEAADEIERLRKALQFIADEPRGTLECVEIARAALSSIDGKTP